MSSSEFAAEAAAALADAAGCLQRASEALMAFAEAAARQGDVEEGSSPGGELPAPVFGLATAGLLSSGSRARPVPPVEIRGPRQRAIFEVLRRAGDDGEITRLVSERVGYGRSNTYMTLKNLQSQGVVELMEGCDPQRWRLRT